MAGLVEAVKADIERRRLFARGELIVVAVSGGLDSMVLLHVLSALATGEGWSLLVAHFNHGLRARASDRDEELVAAVARRLGWPRLCGRAGSELRTRARGVSMEMAAREARHRFLANAAVRAGASKVALGHHADDQAETVFLRLLRGAGGEGLAGLKWSGPSPDNPAIQLVRPLLGHSREALHAFAGEAELVWREDRSNACVDITRNWLRQEIVPRLRRKFGSGLVTTIARAAALVGAEAEFVSERARTWRLARRRAPFASLHPALQRRVLVQRLLECGIDPGFALIEFLRTRPGELSAIGPRRSVWRDAAGAVHVGEPDPRGFGEARWESTLRGGAGRMRFDGLSVAWRIVRRRGGQRLDPRPGREWFDADSVGRRVVLRHWERGDRFCPIGLTADIKLQDLFVNAKVKRAERHERVVAVSERGEVFWVEGLRMAERFKITPRTRRWLEWTWTRDLRVPFTEEPAQPP